MHQGKKAPDRGTAPEAASTAGDKAAAVRAVATRLGSEEAKSALARAVAESRERTASILSTTRVGSDFLTKRVTF
jgi:hypothetical protein